MFKRSLLALTVVFATSQVQAFSLPTVAGFRSAFSTAATFVANKSVVGKNAVVAAAKKAGNSVVNNASAFATLINGNRKSAAAVIVAAISGGYLAKWAYNKYIRSQDPKKTLRELARNARS